MNLASSACFHIETPSLKNLQVLPCFHIEMTTYYRYFLARALTLVSK